MGATKEFQIDPKEVRKRLAMNQQEFWGRIGVAQSAGSRYESGRRMPRPVKELLRVIHIERIDLSNVHSQDFAVLNYLKENEPAFFQRVSALVVNTALQGFTVRNASLASLEPESPRAPERQREWPALDVLTDCATHPANAQVMGVRAQWNYAIASEKERSAGTPAVAVTANSFSVEPTPNQPHLSSWHKT